MQVVRVLGTLTHFCGWTLKHLQRISFLTPCWLRRTCALHNAQRRSGHRHAAPLTTRDVTTPGFLLLLAGHPEILRGRLSRLIHDAEGQESVLAQASRHGGLSGCAVAAVLDPSIESPAFQRDSHCQGESSAVALSETSLPQDHEASPVLEKPKTFADTFKKVLDQPLLHYPRLRVTRSARRSLDPDFVPKRSARLAAKSRFKEGHPDA
jgi:hypothetical protein